MMKQSLSILFLLSASTTTSSAWQSNETSDSYVEWPEDVQVRLSNEYEVYHSDSFPLPVLRAFDTFPSMKNKDNVWDLMKSVNTRLHPILWPRVQYWVEEGIDFGCRIPQEDGSTLPNTTAHCHRHCINQGRYCLPHTMDNHLGRDSIKEIVRRLCMDEIYHAKDPRVIAYMEEYDKQGCFDLDIGERACSIQAIQEVGMHWSALEECLAEEDYEEDKPNTVLNRNLRHVKKLETTTIPGVTINGKPIKKVTSETIFTHFCDAFPSYLQQPLACHVCKDCGNVRECLWNLKCDGVKFEPENVHDDIMGADLAPNGEDSVQVLKTVAPTEEYQDNQHDGDVVIDGVDMEEVDTMELPDTQTTVGLTSTNADKTNASPQEPSKKKKSSGFFLLGILLIVAAVFGGAFFIYRQSNEYNARRAKELLSEIANGKYNQNNNKGTYKDDEELGGRAPEEGHENQPPPADDYRGRAQQLLEEINNGSFKKDNFRDLRQSDMDKASPAVVEDVYGDDGGASDDEKDDIKVEDLLDEESEFVEQKRFSGQALPAIL